jgi:hypothetical protein
VGYKPKRKTYKLVFDDEDMAGLEVRARSMDLGGFLRITEMGDLMGRQITPDDMARVRELFTLFADALLEWNITDDDGGAVPASFAGMCKQEPEFVISVIKAWSEAVGGVRPPLPQPSSGGEQSLEAQIPMEAFSPSPAS